MKKFVFLTILLLFLGSNIAEAQDNSNPKSEKLTSQDKKLLATANSYYKEGNFLRALGIFKVLAESYPGNAEIVYKTGICYLYKGDEKENSILLISKAARLDPKLEDLNYNLGRAYHANYKFEEAIKYFEDYIKENPPVLKKNLAQHFVEFCKNGEVIALKELNMIIDNIGPPINTENSEYVPAISADESVLIFTYKGERSTGGMMDGNFNPSNDGEYYEDVFISYHVGEKWTEPQSIGQNINSKGHDASIALSMDGQKLFVFKSTPKDKGDIYMSELDGEVWDIPVSLGPNVNTKYWEGSVSMSADEQTLYFASERPGGQGGRDIYKSKKEADGTWGPAENLGPTINTSYDEDAPFIHPDGVTLFFSSRGHNSMGGYDIFNSVSKNGEWSEPANMGTPVNTTDDDLYYVLSPDGETGYYSSNRKEGYGQQDIYVITPGVKGTKPIIALAIGKVLLDNKPVSAVIKVLDMDNGAQKGNFKTNSSTGKYMVALTPGSTYKISVEIPGKEPHYEYLNAKTIESYTQIGQDIQIYTPEYMAENKIDSTRTNNLQSKLDEQILKNKSASQPDVYEPLVYEDILRKSGNVKKDSVTYNVDLGTYETASDFDSSKIADSDTIRKVVTAGNYTNYYIGGFATIGEAEAFRKKITEKDDRLKNIAEVTANDRGKTKLLPEYLSAYYSRADYTPRTEPKIIKTKYNPVLEEQKETEKLVSEYGDKKMSGLTYKVEVAAVNKAEEFDIKKMSAYGKVESKKGADGKLHYFIGSFKTLREASGLKTTLTEKEPTTGHSKVFAMYQNNARPINEFFNDPVMTEKLLKANEPVAMKSKPVKTETDNIKSQKSETAKTAQPKTEPTLAVAGNPARDETTPCETGKTYDLASLAGKSLNDPAVYSQLLNAAGAMCVDGLTFKVQIGAYRHPQNYKYNNLRPLGYKVETSDAVGDSITRFTMGEFKTMNDGEKLRQKAINKGTKDAWITAVYNGKRYTLEQLIPLNFFFKAVN